MNLLLVTGRFPERSETFIYRKAVALAERGHNVTVATRQVGDWSLYPNQLPPSLKTEELLPDHTLRHPRRAATALGRAVLLSGRAPARARRLLELCKRRSPSQVEAYRLFVQHLPFVDREVDIVHFEFVSLAAIYPLAREVLTAPVVVSCRGNDVHTLELRPSIERTQALDALRNADGLHCVSTEMAAEVERLIGRTERVWVNRPAVDVSQIAVRRDVSTGPLRLLATGRLVWKKGFDYLLTALAHLVKRGVAFHADIVGDGELKNYLRFSIEDLGLHEHVTLVGAMTSSEVLARMQSTDVFVLSSLEEGISNAVLEAMASGIPIVTTDAGGMAEAVRDGVEGFVVRVRDAISLADRIQQLASEPKLRLTMGEAARGRAETEFSLTRQVEVFESMYRSLIEARRG